MHHPLLFRKLKRSFTLKKISMEEIGTQPPTMSLSLVYLGDEDFLLAFRLLCRTYYPKYKDMVTEYVKIYKELYDSHYGWYFSYKYSGFSAWKERTYANLVPQIRKMI